MSHKKPGIIESVMRNHNIVIIVAVTLMLIGIVALIIMPRNEFPKFTIRQGVIVGIYPGATSAEVEEQLTRTVENYIFGYEEVRKAKTYSQSKDGIMYIFVELNDNVTNADQFWSKLKHGLSELKMTLPPGVLALFADSDFGDTSALLITLSSETKSYKELEAELKKLEKECRKIPSASKIKHYGLQKEKIFIKVKPELLNEYNIKSLSLLSDYHSNGAISYAGVLKNGESDLSVHLPANFKSEKDLSNQIVYSDHNDNVVRLKNIATIERRYEDPENYIKQNGKKTILLSLEMQPGNNIVQFGEEVDKALAVFQQNCPKEIQVAKISELPKYVNDSVKNFMKEFLIAIIAVILITMVLLPMRVAAVAGITVPISVLLTLCILYFLGIELHTVSLASLILVLGMIVDNSIVVIDNHVEKIDHGYSSWHAAIKSAKELFKPILFATLAIMAAYIPLAFLIPGIPGEFMRSIPIVVSVSLIISVFVAMFLVPYLNFIFIKKGLNSNNESKSVASSLMVKTDNLLEKITKYPFILFIISLTLAGLVFFFFYRQNEILLGVLFAAIIIIFMLIAPFAYILYIRKRVILNEPKKKQSFLDRLQKWFDAALEKAFEFPKTVIVLLLALVGFSFILFNNIEEQLFPEMERNQFAVEVYLPIGSSLDRTSKVVDSLEAVLLKDKRVTNVTSFIGSSSPRFHTAYTPNIPSPNYGQLLVNTISNEATRQVVEEQNAKYTEHFANAHVRYKILSLQDYKAPIEIRISSDSIKDIHKVEAQVNSILKQTQGIAWRRTDWDQMQQYIKVKLDGDKAERLGYSNDLVSASLMIGLDGLPLTTIWEKDYPIEVSLSKENSSGHKNIKTIEDLYVTSLSTFSAIPLRSFATFSPDWIEGTIVRRNGVPALTVQVDNEQNVNASAIFDEIKPQLDKLSLPVGTSITYGGESEGQDETFIPMGLALLLSIMAIFFILLFQFKKVKLVFLILSTMVLAFPGAAIGLWLMHYPFSVTAFIGITSLCGMVVRNGIILIDYARELIEKENMSVFEAALAAGKRRMRPIFLTSAAAAVGVIPMILSRSTLWGPLGTVICFGLLIAMVLTLFALPVLFNLVYKAKKTERNILSSKMVMLAVVMGLAAFFTNVEAQSLSLDSCKKLALINNNKIKEAAFDIKSATEERKSAFTEYFPKVSASAMAMKSSDYLLNGKTPEMNLPVYDGNAANIESATQYAYVPSIPINLLNYFSTASVDVTMPLYAGGRISNGNKLASLGEDVSRSQHVLTTIEVLIRTEELYWSLVSLKEKEKTLYSYKVMLDTLYRDVYNYTKAGVVQRNDLLKVQLKQNELQTNMLKLQNGIMLTKMALCQHVGIAYDSALVINAQPVMPQSYAIHPDAQSLVTNRIEYSLLNKAIEAEELQQKLTRGEYLPQLAITGSGSVTDMMGQTTKNAMALVTLSIPISDWWGGSHKIKQHQIKIEKAKIELNENTELLKLQITQADNEVKETFFQSQVAQKSVEQAGENLKVTKDNYKSRAISISDLLEAQAIFQNAKDNLADAKCSYQIKQAKYLQAIGIYK